MANTSVNILDQWIKVWVAFLKSWQFRNLLVITLCKEESLEDGVEVVQYQKLQVLKLAISGFLDANIVVLYKELTWFVSHIKEGTYNFGDSLLLTK